MAAMKKCQRRSRVVRGRCDNDTRCRFGAAARARHGVAAAERPADMSARGDGPKGPISLPVWLEAHSPAVRILRVG